MDGDEEVKEERKMILNLLKDGKIDVDEAERLLTALSIPAADAPVADGIAEQSKTQLQAPKRVKISVMENGKMKVNLRLPLSLLKLGLKLGKSSGYVGSKLRQYESEEDVMNILQTIDVDEIVQNVSDGIITLPCTLIDGSFRLGEYVKVVLE